MTISTSNLDAGAKSPRAARSQLYDAINAINGCLIPYDGTVSYPVGSVGAHGRAYISVLDYFSTAELADFFSGALTLDYTAAFNRATKSTTTWSAVLEYDILVPPGHYRLDGTVYVRKGQTLCGFGHGTFFTLSGNTTSDTFVLGVGRIGGVETIDAGGSPCQVKSFWTSGGSASGAVVRPAAAGFSIDSLFITFPGTGLNLSGCADGIVSNVTIDQCLTAMHLDGSQNVILNNVIIYLPNFGVTFGSNNRDIIFNGLIIEYPQYSAILVQPSTANNRAISFNGMNITMNVQYSTMISSGYGLVQCDGNEVELAFTGGSMRNWPTWAICSGTGVNSRIVCTGVIFDGLATTTAYTQGTTSRVLNTGYHGNYLFYGCEFRNINNELFTVNSNLTQLSVIGGSIVNCDSTTASRLRINFLATDVPNISFRNVKGVPVVQTVGSNLCFIMPYWGASTGWKLALKGNTQASGDSSYSAMEEAVYTVTWQYSGSVKTLYVDKMLLWKTPTRSLPGDLGAVVGFGGTPGGVTTMTTFSRSGFFCVSVPFSSYASFDVIADTVT